VTRAGRLLLLMMAVAPAASADEETAQFFLGRGREELDAGRLDKARHWLDRALKEEASYAPALLLAADLALKQGRREEAVRHLEACLARENAKNPSEEAKRAVRDARARLKDLDRARFELEEILGDYVRRVSDLARKHEKDDAELARACWKNVLLVDPKNAAAKRGVEGVAPAQADGDAIFNGKNLSGWNGEDPAWTVRRGVLTGEQRDAGNVNRFLKEVKGKYSIVCDARAVEDVGPTPAFAILFGLRNKNDHFGIWVWPEGWAYQHATRANDFDELAKRDFKHHDRRFSRFDWHTYRIDVDDKKVTVYVNGKKLFSTSGAVRALDGWVALMVQDEKAQFRNVRLVRK
jgi:tetratricopeptide (TPR) repeat protein